MPERENRRGSSHAFLTMSSFPRAIVEAAKVAQHAPSSEMTVFVMQRYRERLAGLAGLDINAPLKLGQYSHLPKLPLRSCIKGLKLFSAVEHRTAGCRAHKKRVPTMAVTSVAAVDEFWG